MTDINQQLAQSLVPVITQVTRNYNTQLYNLGKDGIQTIVRYSVDQLPVPLNNYLKNYLDVKSVSGDSGSEIPSWIGDVIEPIYSPVVEGGQEEITRIMNKVNPFIYTALFLILGGAFIGGYLVGRKK
ncbi:MAG: hypothetical protein M0P71_07260 [Melioribacteraceae bacterium]|jgi:hypothetical protein|nr:hypothetical protein [Melioribacteraceae bacterium]MDD3982848.1 hypothetical protein [Candidatus Omnitrophota bacterium]